VPASSPVKYFLEIGDVAGETSDKGSTVFAVDGFAFGLTTSSSAGSSGKGANPGTTEFSPLTVDIHSLTGISQLLQDEVAGTDLRSVDLVGIETVNGKAQTVYDLKLGNALVADFDNTPGAQGLETSLTFSYQKLSLLDHSLSLSGRPGSAETVAFDTTAANAASLLTNFMASSGLASGSQGSNFIPLTHEDKPWST